MKQYPLYANPYDDMHIDNNTDLELHMVVAGEEAEISKNVTSMSPYATKLDVYLRMFGIKHHVVVEPIPDGGPRGKVPFIIANGVRLTDSQLVIDFLKKTLADPDDKLTIEQKALGHVVKKTLEDHLYWIIIYYEFFDQRGFDFLIGQSVGDVSALPEEVQEAIAARRDDFRQRAFDQGIARYTVEEIIAKAKLDLEAISVILGSSDFLLGDAPTSYDATLFGFTQAFFQVRGMHPEITDYARTIPNLGRYIQRVQEKWYPELELAFTPA